ncbi:MAG: TetR/AcrR family transcriptional regulator, partial [Actinobacteria bacterium]|nr:TetR/AcrR family transcriptional regulator [Actinomycetota bacterium]
MASETLRETVLKAAVDYIAENGADGLSFRQVAIAAGVSHQAPYHHFSDRKGIFEAIAIEGFEIFTDAMEGALDARPNDPASALLEAYVEFAVGHRGHFRVMFRPDLC